MAGRAGVGGEGGAAGGGRYPARMNKTLLAASAALWLTACSSTSNWQQYGDGTDVAATAVSVDQVLADPAAYEGKTLRVRGPIVGTCAHKGCWMRVGSAADNVFVKFKDYGFFVPTGGVEGKETVIDGQLSVEVQSVDEVKHYLEDAGKHEEAAKVTEPRKVVSFLATGVAIQTDK